MNAINVKMLAMNAGLDAATEKLPRDSNPYQENYFLYQWWDLGWLEYDGEENSLWALNASSCSSCLAVL